MSKLEFMYRFAAVVAAVVFAVAVWGAAVRATEGCLRPTPAAKEADVVELSAEGEVHQYAKYMHGMSHLPNCRFCREKSGASARRPERAPSSGRTLQTP